jgi:hypothetical protein
MWKNVKRAMWENIKRGWRVATEAHTALWILGAVLPAPLVTYLARLWGEHEPAFLILIFAVVAALSILVVLSILGRASKGSSDAQDAAATLWNLWDIGAIALAFILLCLVAIRISPNPKVRFEYRNDAEHIRQLPDRDIISIDFLTEQRWPDAVPYLTYLSRVDGNGNCPLDPRPEKIKLCYAHARLDWFNVGPASWMPTAVLGKQPFIVAHLFESGKRLAFFSDSNLADLDYIVDSSGNKQSNKLPNGRYDLTVLVDSPSLGLTSSQTFRMSWFGSKESFSLERMPNVSPQ